MFHPLLAVAALLQLEVICCQGNVISWPDPNQLRVVGNPVSGRHVSVFWPVTRWAHQDQVLEFECDILRAKDGELVYKYVDRYPEQVEAFLPVPPNSELIIVVRVRTLFKPNWIEVTRPIRTGGMANYNGSLPTSTKPVSPITADGEGPFLVVLRDQVTRVCSLVIYDLGGVSSSKHYTVESSNICAETKRAIYVPIDSTKIEARGIGGSARSQRMLNFTVDEDLLETLTPYTVEAYSMDINATDELDPPQDVSAKIHLESAHASVLRFTFRPPASRHDLIRKFSFKLSNSPETIVISVVNDSDITRSTLIAVQALEDEYLTVDATGLTFGLREKYTLLVWTNDAFHKKRLFTVEMPDFPFLAPKKHQIKRRTFGIKVSWSEPQFFGSLTTCDYNVTALPLSSTKDLEFHGNVSIQKGLGFARFREIPLGAHYRFRLLTRCPGMEAQWTDLGVEQMPEEIPGNPENVTLTFSNKDNHWKLTWEPPKPAKCCTVVYYNVLCTHKQAKQTFRGITRRTIVHFKMPSTPGNFSCRVFAKFRHVNELGGVNSDAVFSQVIVIPAIATLTAI